MEIGRERGEEEMNTVRITDQVKGKKELRPTQRRPLLNPDIVAALSGSNCEVYLDGGIRMGTDVLKALALGAR